LPGCPGTVSAISDGVSAIAALNGPNVVAGGENPDDTRSPAGLRTRFGERRKRLSVAVIIGDNPFLPIVTRLWGYSRGLWAAVSWIERDRQLLAGRREDSIVDNVGTGFGSGHC